MLAYLVIREGAKWTDVFRLIAGQTVTIGRAPTNHIVLKDERCSRYHAEIFLRNGRWTVRDLDSRNGTTMQNQPINGELLLSPGDVLRIGRSQLAFVHDLSKAFPDSSSLIVKEFHPDHQELPLGIDETRMVEEPEQATITFRRAQSRFLHPTETESEEAAEFSRQASALCRLTLELYSASDVPGVAALALDGLLQNLNIHHGAVLLFHREPAKEPNADDLEPLVTRTRDNKLYTRVPVPVANTVLRQREAVLGRNLPAVGSPVSHDTEPTTLVAAPLRFGERVLGLVHLYSTDSHRPLQPMDVDFALAVADVLAVKLKKLSLHDELTGQLTRVQEENRQLRQQLGAESGLVGKSLAMSRVSEQIDRAAPLRTPLLIQGEPGVGKELVARAIHFSGPRSQEPLIVLHCGAWGEAELSAALFGGDKAGLNDRTVGKLVAADRGTLLLHEISALSQTLQAKLVRFLEGRPLDPVAGQPQRDLDVRIIATTSRDLERDVAEGRFRQDLFFRLHVLEIVIPALHRRPEDIPELAGHFLLRFREETGRPVQGFTPAALEALMKYRWPGNVRELRNVIERAVTLARNEQVDVNDLTLFNLPSSEANPRSVPLMTMAEVERQHLQHTLETAQWNRSQAASWLGMDLATLDQKIHTFGLTGGPNTVLPPRAD